MSDTNTVYPAARNTEILNHRSVHAAPTPEGFLFSRP